MRFFERGGRGLLPLLVMLVAVSGAACASGGGGAPRGSQSELTRAEMGEAMGSNLYDIVEQLRPRWLQVRAVRSLSGATGQIGVYIDRNYQGGPEVLRNLAPAGVERLYYLDSSQASNQLRSPGADAMAGAIVIEMAGR